MSGAPLPSHEAQRLELLRSYGILDTEAEQSFDEIVELAATICDVPTALISLVDEKRQWFKAKIGLEATETSRDVAFCAHAILAPEELFVVEDAVQDARFKDNPLVTGDAAIRFYAGCPLYTQSGHALGTLCVIDTKPKTLNDQQKRALEILTHKVVELVEARKNVRALKEREQYTQMMEEEAAIGYWRIDLQKDKIFWSDQTYAIHGIVPGVYEPDLNTAIDYYHHEDQVMVREKLEYSIFTKQPFTFEARLITADGDMRYVQSRGRHWASGAGDEYIFGTFQDITERKSKEEELVRAQQFQQLIKEANPDLIFVKNEKLEIIDANSAFLNLHTNGNHGIVAQTALHDSDGSDPDLHVHAREALEHGFSRVQETVTLPDGKSHIFDTQRIRFEDGSGKKFILGIGRDITDPIKEERMLNDIYRITTDAEYTLEQKMQRVLEVGMGFFEMSLGIVSRIVDDRYIIEYVAPDTEPARGQEFDFKDTYCAHTFESGIVQAWHHVAHSDIAKHPCYANFALESYIGATIYVQGEAYGTINFTHKLPREKAFLEREKAFINLIAQWVGSEIGRQNDLSTISEAQAFQDLVNNNNPDLIFVKDANYRIVKANPAFLNVYPEDKREHVIGYTTLEEYEPDAVEAFLARDKSAFETGYNEVIEELTFPDGEVRTLVTKKIRFENANHELFILGIGHDITELKKAENELVSIGRILEDSLNEVYVFDAESLYFLQVNRGARENLDYTMDELSHMTPVDIKPLYTKDTFMELMAPLIDGDEEKIVFEAQHRRKDGSTYDVEIYLQRSYYLDKEAYVAIVLDISDRNRAEAEKESLIEKLTQSNSELERFAYVASHDMQEPLRMITSFGEIITNDYADVIDETGREYLKLITDAGSRMKDMIQDLLEYSKVDNDGARMSAFNGAEVLDNVLDNLRNLIDETDAVITCDTLPIIYGNPVQIMRLLQNLIANAIKYQPEGRTPKIHVGLGDWVDHWCICVKDNGAGIEAKFLQQIFQPFRRLQNWDNVTGSGLGLSICRKIVEKHGGKIWVKSKLGEGSVFYFTLLKITKDDANNALSG